MYRLQFGGGVERGAGSGASGFRVLTRADQKM